MLLIANRSKLSWHNSVWQHYIDWPSLTCGWLPASLALSKRTKAEWKDANVGVFLRHARWRLLSVKFSYLKPEALKAASTVRTSLQLSVTPADTFCHIILMSAALFNVSLSSSSCLIFSLWVRVLRGPERDEKDVMDTDFFFFVLLQPTSRKVAPRKPSYCNIIK